MSYDIRMLLRKIFTVLFRRKCQMCLFYDGRFGCDECFECEKSITAVNYERGIT